MVWRTLKIHTKSDLVIEELPPMEASMHGSRGASAVCTYVRATLWMVMACMCTANALPSVHVTFPVDHSWWQVDYNASSLGQLGLFFTVDDFQIPGDGYLVVTGQKIQEGHRHESPIRSITLSGVEPGSHFWTLTLFYANGTQVPGPQATTTVHIEVVIPQNEKLLKWRYDLTQEEHKPTILVSLPVADRPMPAKTPLCFATTTKGGLDGQKKIWLQVIAALKRTKSNWDVQIKSFEHTHEDAPLSQALRQLNVSIQGIPLQIARDDLYHAGIDDSKVTATLVSAFNTAFAPVGIMTSMSASSEPRFSPRHRNSPIIDRIQPQFARSFWQKFVGELSSCADGVLVFANSRSLADKLLVQGARAAGVRAIVMELANLMPERLDVDVLIGPSHFALHHPSVARSVTARSRHVMFTGVDTTLFAPSTNIFRSEGFTIGYVGRLSTEKSVGVLLNVAKLLVDRGIPCRVRIIGDGSQRERLKALSASWNLSSIVTFTAAIYDPPRLAEEFQRLDVYVSSRFEETLGIAPLEAMSCGVPVVGFATGGVGDFLEDGVNGIAVKEPTPEAMTEAIMLLYQNHSLRQRLGAQARQTVKHRYSDKRGIQQYLALYERLRKPR